MAWAIASTASAAASTLAYLAVIHGDPGANAFIHLYSTVGMASAWLNTALFFYPERARFLYSRRGAFAAAFAAFCFCLALVRALFELVPTLYEAGFVAALLLPILYAPAYGFHFRAGNYRAVYGRGIALNLAYLAAVLPAAIFNNISLLYPVTAVILPCGLAYWLASDFFRAGAPRAGMTAPLAAVSGARALANPALPVLDRVLWDQYALIRFAIADFTFWLYALGRVISFSGNVLFSYSTQESLRGETRARGLALAWLAGVAGALGLLGLGEQAGAQAPFLLGQYSSWLLAASLLREFESPGKSYWQLFCVWIAEAAVRCTSAFFLPLAQYVRLSSALCIAMALGYFLATMVSEKSRHSADQG